MVHSDDWPIHEFANTNIVPFTYAIDKWEPYLSSGSITNGTPGVCTSTNCISSTTAVFMSASGQTPVGWPDYYAGRKGCANRTAAGYTGATTQRSVHLTTEMEQFVGNYGTPDNYFSTFGSQLLGTNLVTLATPGYGGCNTELKHNSGNAGFDNFAYYNTGDVGTKNCISRYGVRDMIGNFSEVTDVYYENMTNNVTRQKSVYWGTPDKITTVISDAVLGYVVPVAGSQFYYVHDWDYQNLLPKTYIGSVNPNPKFFMDGILLDPPAGAAGNITDRWSWQSGTAGGRFSKQIDTITANWLDITARCAITSP